MQKCTVKTTVERQKGILQQMKRHFFALAQDNNFIKAS